MKRYFVLLILSLLLLGISLYPLFQIIREFKIDADISSRYAIEHADIDEQGFRQIIDKNEITIDGVEIKIVEEFTGKKAPLTTFDKDENVPPGDIVNIHLLVNDELVSEPSEIWLSNRDRGSRYFSWIDILTVKDYATGETFIKIVQRLSDDLEMDEREWKIISINAEGEVTEEKISYSRKNNNPLAVKLINFSNTSLMSLGYYSDITQGYPSLIFPIVFPYITSIIGAIGAIFSIKKYAVRVPNNQMSD